MKKKALNTNIEIYNYLNITNRKLGKLYKYSGYTFLPASFDITPETIKERLYLNEMEKSDIFPPFVLNDKKSIKKCFKNSLKNIKKIRKNAFFEGFSHNFSQKLEIYFDMRFELTKLILKDFDDQNFDETSAYQELFNLNAVLGELFDELYQPKVDIEKLFDGLEEKYNSSYIDKLKELEKSQQKEKRKSAQKTLQNEHETFLKNNKKMQKKAEKSQDFSKNKNIESVESKTTVSKISKQKDKEKQ